MIQKTLALIATLMMVLGIDAENYPYRSDYLFVTVPDHADWLYDIGEKAKIDGQYEWIMKNLK